MTEQIWRRRQLPRSTLREGKSSTRAVLRQATGISDDWRLYRQQVGAADQPLAVWVRLAGRRQTG